LHCTIYSKRPCSEDISTYYQSAEYVSHSDTKEGLINNLYHRVRNYTLGTKRKLLEQITEKKNGALLDVGQVRELLRSPCKMPDGRFRVLNLTRLQERNAQKKYGLLLHTLENLFTLHDNSFDVITLWHVLEHVHQLHDYLEKFKSLLKKDGCLVVAVPNYVSGDAEHYKEYWAAYDVPRHLYHFSPRSMQVLMEQHGFSITVYKPMWFDSFYVSLLSEKYKNKKSSFLKAVWNGFTSNTSAFSDPKKWQSVIYIIKKAG
jgi:predicted SAM-dependent methyltransferase